jgi:hypothetical protein
MNIWRAWGLVLTLGTGLAMTTAAEAAPRLLFKGCAFYGVPGCILMRATDGKVYQLIGPPSLPAYSPIVVYANRGAEVSLCFAPTAQVRNWKPDPRGKC